MHAMKIFTWTKRLVLTLSFMVLIATNVLTLTSTAFNAALSGLLSAKLGVQTVSGILDRQLKAKNKIIKKQTATLAKRKTATKKFGRRLASRTKRIATASMASIPGEAIPVIGATLLIAGTGYELYLACEKHKGSG
jgi:hypothetical protein